MPSLLSIAAPGSRLAACAATGCGVHCALSPILIPVMPALGLSEGVERGAFVATFILGALMIALGPGRSHVPVVTLFASGALVWAASLSGALLPLPEPLTSAVGSLVMAGALFDSVRRCAPNQCSRCDSEAPGDLANLS